MTFSSTPILRADDLVKQVHSPAGPLTILQDVSLHVDAGDTVAVVGVSGSGKSTLLGLLAGLDVPTSGTVSLDGVILNDLDEDGRAALRLGKVGFVFQAFHLLPGLSALENVMLPAELNRSRSSESVARTALERVGLGERLEHYPAQLSGGEQQRVAIARAFAVPPKILFADEPTGNLDHATGERVIDLLFSLNREHDTTLVLVTHDDTLGARCHTHLRLDAGRLVDGDGR